MSEKELVDDNIFHEISLTDVDYYNKCLDYIKKYMINL
jgi:hypothetical protein